MAIQGRFLKVFNIWGNYKNVLSSTNRTLPNLQQVACLRKESLEEKYNIPVKPKRPLTPYFKFMAQIRPEVKKQFPTSKPTDIAKQIAVRWEKCDPKLKLSLEDEYKKEQEEYAKEKLQYDTILTEEQRSILKEVQVAKSEDKQKRKYRKKCREYNKPKKPCSAYVLYMKDQLPNRGNQDFKVWLQECGKKWNALSEEQKKPYIEEQKDSFKEYSLKISAWEKEMIKLGNLDIVRQEALLDPHNPKFKKEPKKVAEKKTEPKIPKNK